MRNHLLEEVYDGLGDQKDSTPSELLTEAPTQEQEWLSKNIISPLQKAIDGLNVARSHLPTFISRQEVMEEKDKIHKSLNRMLEIWHNIEDVMGKNRPTAMVKEESTPDNWYAPAEDAAVTQAKKLLKKHKRTSCYITLVVSGQHTGEWVITPDKRSETSKLVSIT